MNKNSRNWYKITIIIMVLIAAGLGVFWALSKKPKTASTEPSKSDLIHVESPQPNQIIESPLLVTGEARGSWFFEASFPVVLVNWDGLIIAQGVATAQGEWTTNNFVPFTATLTFTADKNAYSNKGALILRKDNPSSLPEHDDSIEIPIMFAK